MNPKDRATKALRLARDLVEKLKEAIGLLEPILSDANQPNRARVLTGLDPETESIERAYAAWVDPVDRGGRRFRDWQKTAASLLLDDAYRPLATKLEEGTPSERKRLADDAAQDIQRTLNAGAPLRAIAVDMWSEALAEWCPVGDARHTKQRRDAIKKLLAPRK